MQATGAVLSHESRQQHEQTHRMLGQLMKRMDTSFGAQDSSEDLHQRWKLQKKRERDQQKADQKQLQLFQVGIQPEQNDEFLSVVLVKANSERQMEPLQGRDLGAQICCCGLSCRLVLVDKDYGLLQLVAPVDLAQLKAATAKFGLNGIELLAVHKKEVHRGLLWKERGAPQLVFQDGEKVPKQAVLRLKVSRVGEKIARQLPLAEEPPAKRPALASTAVRALTFEPIAEAFPELPESQAMEELEDIPEPEKAPEAPIKPKAPEAPVEPPEEAVPEKPLELYEMPMAGKMLRFYFLRTELVRRITHAVVKLHGAEDHALLETRRDDFKMFPGKGEEAGLCYIHNAFFEREAQKAEAKPAEDDKPAEDRKPAEAKPAEDAMEASSKPVEPEPVQRRGGPLARQLRRPKDDKPAEDDKPAGAKPAEDAMEASSSDKPPELPQPDGAAAPDELQDKPSVRFLLCSNFSALSRSSREGRRRLRLHVLRRHRHRLVRPGVVGLRHLRHVLGSAAAVPATFPARSFFSVWMARSITAFSRCTAGSGRAPSSPRNSFPWSVVTT